jgi:hypothetical protein
MKNRTLIYEHFKTLNHFLDVIDGRPLNAVFQKKSIPSSQRIEDNKRFTGTFDYKEAMQVLKDGYKDPLNKMKKAILKIGEMDNYQRPRIKNDFVGFVPHVPNTLMNLPQTMINKQKLPQKSKTIHLTYSPCVHSGISTDDIIESGILFVSLVNSLEKQNYRVKIDILMATASDKNAAIYTCNVKEYDQTLNLLKLTFPLVHPSMLRRFSFKWLETVPNLKDSYFLNGYGYPLGTAMNYEKEKEFLTENGILKDSNSYYINAYTAIKAKNIEELSKKIGLVK